MPDMLETRFHFSTLLKFLIGFVFFRHENSDLLDACFRTFFKITEASDVLDARFRMLFVACVGP